MFKKTRKTTLIIGAVTGLLFALPSYSAEQQTYKFKIQTAVPSSSLYYKLLQKFSNRLDQMSDGRLQAEVLPDGAIVGAFDILDAVDHGVVKAGFAWPHYWSGKNPAYMLFSNAPASTGLDQRSLMAWYYHGGGQKLYQRLNQKINNLNVVSFMIQPMGPDPLGWFEKPIKSMKDFKKLKYRAPPGIAGKTYEEMGISAVTMPGGDVVPAAQRGVIDAAEWIGPADDRNLGLQKIWKYYYLQGLHQETDIGEIEFNKKFWGSLPKDLKAIVHTAILASQTETYNADIYDNAKAVHEFQNQDNVHVLDTPKDYYKKFVAAQQKVVEKYARQNDFFKKVLESQRNFADMVYPYRSRVLELYSNLVTSAHKQRNASK